MNILLNVNIPLLPAEQIKGFQGTDVGALSEGYVSITPLQLDLTNYPAMWLLCIDFHDSRAALDLWSKCGGYLIIHSWLNLS
jgi:broad specificity polyphosphatase/5'/3'-nucleotidase SurE